MDTLHRGSKSIKDSASGHDLLNRAIFPDFSEEAQRNLGKGKVLRKSPDRKVLKSFLSRARNRTVIFHRRQAGRGITTLGQRLMDDLKDLEASISLPTSWPQKWPQSNKTWFAQKMLCLLTT